MEESDARMPGRRSSVASGRLKRFYLSFLVIANSTIQNDDPKWFMLFSCIKFATAD